MNARLATERVDDEAGVVGKRRLAGRARRGQCLDARVLGECLAGFFRLGETKLTGGLRSDAVGRKQLAHFLELAGIVRGDDDRACKPAVPAHITAIFCKPTSFSTPLRASASSARN